MKRFTLLSSLVWMLLAAAACEDSLNYRRGDTQYPINEIYAKFIVEGRIRDSLTLDALPHVNIGFATGPLTFTDSTGHYEAYTYSIPLSQAFTVVINDTAADYLSAYRTTSIIIPFANPVFKLVAEEIREYGEHFFGRCYYTLDILLPPVQ